MRKLVFTVFLLAAFPMSGLVSCAPDKKTTEGGEAVRVQYVNDDFKLAPPQIVSGSHVTDAVNGITVSTKFSTEDRLVFPSLVKQDFKTDPIVFTIDSSCIGSVRKTEQLKFLNLSEIRLRDMVPAEGVFAPGQRPEPTACTWTISVTNRHGSLHKFTLPRIEVKAPDDSALDLTASLANAPLNRFVPNNPVVTDQSFGRIQFKATTTTTPKDEVVHLLCEGFRAEIKRQAGGPMPLFSDLVASDRIAYSDMAIKGPGELPQQDCRIAIDRGGENPTRMATPSFSVLFGPPSLEISTSFALNGFPGPTVRHPEVLTIQISNPHASGIPVAIPFDSVGSLTLRPVVTQGTQGVHQARTVRVSLRVEGANPIDDADHLKFVVPAKGTVVVKGEAQMVMVCNVRDIGGPPNPHDLNQSFNGFYFDFAKDRFPLKFTGRNSLEGEAKWVSSLPLPLDLGPSIQARPLPHWAPWNQAGGTPFKNVPEQLEHLVEIMPGTAFPKCVWQ